MQEMRCRQLKWWQNQEFVSEQLVTIPNCTLCPVVLCVERKKRIVKMNTTGRSNEIEQCGK